MKYLYKINSAYDGFTPQKIEERLEKGTYLRYNWKEYFDEISVGDVIFTYFTGSGVKKGIYLICKVSQISKNKQVLGRVLHYDQKEPLLSPEEFEKYKRDILTRPIGSVYVIPSFLDIIFEHIRKKVTISEIEMKEKINCHKCVSKNCIDCSILDTKFFIKWDNEVALDISNLDCIVSPFWIIPRQSHWIKKTITEHLISRIFYDFKSGYKLYARLLAFAIMKTMRNNPKFKSVHFNYIFGVPLSPEKKKNGELDRVSEICKILSKEMGVEYLEEGLSLTKHVTRKEYKSLGKQTFAPDYYKSLELKTPIPLDGKNILLVDDVVTDGVTLKVTSKKIKDSFPNCRIYAATAGIMAKVNNMKQDVIDKFKK